MSNCTVFRNAITFFASDIIFNSKNHGAKIFDFELVA